MFVAEGPIQEESQDALGRAPFATALAKALLSYSGGECLVTGVFGPWGSGKSSLINLTIKSIEKLSAERPKTSRPIVIRFNPWNFSDQNQLTVQFFQQLSISLKRSDYAEEAKAAGEALETYSRLLLPLTLVFTSSGWPLLSMFQNSASLVGKALSRWGRFKQKSVEQAKESIASHLRKSSCKILIVIDDIDRLTETETRQIFQLVKSLADFPNIIYILSFDKKIVIDTLKDVQKGDGEEYLEKIVHVPFEVPILSSDRVRRLFTEKLDPLVVDSSPERFDRNHWVNLYQSGLKDLITNLREVTRIINSIAFAKDLIGDDVNVVDLVAITILKTIEPDMYEAIRDNKALFVGPDYQGSFGRSTGDNQKAIQLKEIVGLAKKLKPEKSAELICRLFPRTRSALGLQFLSSGNSSNWRKDLRICHEQHFDTYFNLSVPDTTIREAEIFTLIRLSSDSQAATSFLHSYIQSGRIGELLERLEDFTDKEIPEENISSLVSALVDIGELLPETDDGFFSLGNDFQLMRIVIQLLVRFPSQRSRFEVIRDVFLSLDSAIYIPVRLASYFKNEYTPEENGAPLKNPIENTLSLEDSIALESVVVEIVKKWAFSGRLPNHKRFLSIMYFWSRQEDQKPHINQWLSQLVSTPTGAVRFLVSCLQTVRSQSGDNYSIAVSEELSLKHVKDFIDPSVIEKPIREIQAGKIPIPLDRLERLAINQFVTLLDSNSLGQRA